MEMSSFCTIFQLLSLDCRWCLTVVRLICMLRFNSGSRPKTTVCRAALDTVFKKIYRAAMIAERSADAKYQEHCLKALSAGVEQAFSPERSPVSRLLCLRDPEGLEAGLESVK